MTKPLFTTKHFKAIGRILQAELMLIKEEKENASQFWFLVDRFSDEFMRDNPKFDNKEFRKRVNLEIL